MKYICGKPAKFKCPFESCDYRAKRKQYIKQHIRNIHKVASSEKNFTINTI